MEVVINRCERAIATGIVCPLCRVTFTLQTLKKHLGLHLQEIALFVLPHLSEDSCEESNEGRSKNELEIAGYLSGSSVGHSSRKSSFGSESDSISFMGDQLIISPVAIEGMRCICSYQHDDGFLITCSQCRELQHGVCMGIDKNNVPEVYECSVCIPSAHNLEIEAAINIQESFLKSYQGLLSTTATPSQSTPFLGPSGIEAIRLTPELFCHVIERIIRSSRLAKRTKHKRRLDKCRGEVEMENSIFTNTWDTLVGRSCVLIEPNVEISPEIIEEVISCLPKFSAERFINDCQELNTVLEEFLEEFQDNDQNNVGIVTYWQDCVANYLL